MLSDQTLSYAEGITTALLGVDRYYRQESGDEEGLVVLNMASSTHQPEIFGSYDEASQRFIQLRTAATNLPEPDRRRYYDQVCNSTLAFIQWRQTGLPFSSQLSSFIHVPSQPAGENELDALRAEMRNLLNKMGYQGDISAQFAVWQEKNRVPADEVPGVIQSLLDEAWERTNRILPIPADKSDGMQVLPVSGVHFNARCNYLERRIELNTDPILTRPSLKHLAIHEAYPGHYVQFKLRETWYRQGLAPADGLLSVVNTASSCTFEGIADNGMVLLDWLESDHDRLLALLGRYRAGIGTVAAWQMHALHYPPERVRDYLRANALVGGEGWINSRMGFISALERAVLIWTYWWGQAVVTPAYQKVSPHQRPDFLKFLYGRMHSNDTVRMF